MARRHIVDDSEDDGSDFSPAKSLIGTAQVLPATKQSITTPSQARGTGSTDTSFFRSVYNGHLNQNVGGSAPAQDSVVISTSAIDETVLGESGVNNSVISLSAIDDTTSTVQDTSRKMAAANSSSITDPVMGPPPRGSKPSSGALADITEVTTPGREPSTSNHDIWEVSSSPAVRFRGGEGVGPSSSLRRSPRSANLKTYSKRKRDLQLESSPLQWQPPPAPDAAGVAPPDVVENEDTSPMPARKRRTQSAQPALVTAQEDVEMVVVPRSEDVSKLAGSDNSNGKPNTAETRISETQRVLEVSISQHRMTSSQRKQYKSVSSPSEFDTAAQEPVLPPVVNQKSSDANTTSTIAYPTPSDFASSKSTRPKGAPKASQPASAKSSASKRKIRASVVDEVIMPSLAQILDYPLTRQPSSSPDIIAGPSGRTKRRKAVHDVQISDPWDSDEIGFHKETYNPRLSRRRSGGQDTLPDTDPGQDLAHPSPLRKVDGSNTEPILIASSAPERADDPLGSVPQTELPKAQKRRGRKKNAAIAAEVPASAQDGVSEANTGEVPQAPKRKRGRPKKSEVRKSPEPASQETSQLPGAIKSSKNPDTADVPVSSHAHSRSLTEKSANVMSPPPEPPSQPASSFARPAEDGKENLKGQLQESKEELSKNGVRDETPKSDAAQQGKVGYRVGLSKRSRIAPLLKIIRK